MRAKFSLAFLIFILVINSCLFGQEKYDQLIYKDKTSIRCKILKVTDKTLEVDPEGEKPFLIINRDNVDYIIYADNTVVQLSIKDEMLDKRAEDNDYSNSNNDSWKSCIAGVEVFKGWLRTRPQAKNTFSKEFNQFIECEGKKLEIYTSVTCDFKNNDKLLWMGDVKVYDLKIIIKINDSGKIIYQKEKDLDPVQLTSKISSHKEIDSFKYGGKDFIIKIDLGPTSKESYNVGTERSSWTNANIRLVFSTSDWISTGN